MQDFLYSRETQARVSDLKRQDIRLGSYRISLSSQTLQKGALMGNFFRLNLKRLRYSDEDDGVSGAAVPKSEFVKAIGHVAKNGFLNFFGEQRIGDAGEYDEVGAKSSDIGLSLIKADFQGAVQHIMVGRKLIKGKKTGGGRRLFFAEAHAYDREGNLVASAVSTCRYASNAK